MEQEGVTRTSRTEGEMFLSPQSRSTKLTLKLTLPKLSRHSNLLKITRGFQKLRKLEELARISEDGLQQLLELLKKNFKLLYTVELYGGDVQPAALPLEVQDHTKIECSK